jgi:hypothetical protein
MRIHTDTLHEPQISMAATLAGVEFTRLHRHGSRSRDHAFDVILSGNSPRRQNFGTDHAATWDQWGHFLGSLFDLDPLMVCWAYRDADDFHWVTGDRFRNFNLADDHTSGHKWRWSGDAGTECVCGAVRRWSF